MCYYQLTAKAAITELKVLRISIYGYKAKRRNNIQYAAIEAIWIEREKNKIKKLKWEKTKEKEGKKRRKKKKERKDYEIENEVTPTISRMK